MHKDTLALYSGRLTLANGAFLLLYTAWLQWTARIVAPRHFLRLHTASLWIAPVVGEDTFSPSSARARVAPAPPRRKAQEHMRGSTALLTDRSQSYP